MHSKMEITDVAPMQFCNLSGDWKFDLLYNITVVINIFNSIHGTGSRQLDFQWLVSGKKDQKDSNLNRDNTSGSQE